MVRFFNRAIVKPPTPVKKLIPALDPDIQVTQKPVILHAKWFPHRQYTLFPYASKVTLLFKYERLKMPMHMCLPIRECAERLIADAIRYGDKHIPTMEIADHFLHEKGLIYKLFHVYVPRYADHVGAFTKLWKLGLDYSIRPDKRNLVYHMPYHNLGVLEMKGNPLPPIMPPARKSKSQYLTNVLLKAARMDYYEERAKSSELSNDDTD